MLAGRINAERGEHKARMVSAARELGPGVERTLKAFAVDEARPAKSDTTTRSRATRELHALLDRWIAAVPFLNQVTWEMRVMAGSPSFLASQELSDVRYSASPSKSAFGAFSSTAPRR